MPFIIVSAGVTVVSADASALAVNQPCMGGALIAGHVSNTTALYLGGSTTQALFLPSGTVVPVPVSNLNQLYARTSAGSATATWLVLAGGPQA
jgi:hypothetical protein